MIMVYFGTFNKMVLFSLKQSLLEVSHQVKKRKRYFNRNDNLFLGAIEPGQTPVSGGMVAEGLYGPHHQHFFNMRIDWMLDGQKNSLVEVNCEAIPKGPKNPAGNGWIAQETVLKTVGEARRLHDAPKGRLWKIINPQVKNHVNQAVAYKIVPSGPACFPLCDIDSGHGGRGALARYHLWATRYHPEELYAAGLFSNQSKGDEDGIAVYSEKHKDESLVECDLVTWYTFGCTHIVRAEDWPIMPVETVGFRLQPVGFFAGCPAMDVAPPVEKKFNGTSCDNH
jgi:primary-amine oxidase